MLRTKDLPGAPEPSYMSTEQKAEYLCNLRTGTFAKPAGSRPPPPSRYTSTRRAEAETTQTRDARGTRPPLLATSQSMPSMQPQSQTHARDISNVSTRHPFAGRPLIRQPAAPTLDADAPSPTEEKPAPRHPDIPYVERGTRWMEKQEIHSIREALEEMDMKTEQKLYDAAQDEAAELVYKHQNPEATSHGAYPNPDIRKDYRSHLRKGSYQRSLSREIEPVIAHRKTSGGSHESSGDSTITSIKRRSMEILRKVSPPSAEVLVEKRRSVDVHRKITPPSTKVVVEKRQVPSSGKSYGGLAEAVADDIVKAHRRSSSGSSSRRMMSGEKKKPYMHPKDRIWEDPQEQDDPPTLQLQVQDPVKSNDTSSVHPAHIRKNPFSRVRMQATERLERSRSEPIVTAPMRHNVEIQKNSPSQSRRPWYMSNEPLPPTPPPNASDQPADEVSPKVTPTKDGREIRGDDIRAATSKKRSDYSPKLPRPTVVSDKPGRPIVSFQKDWKPKEVVLEGCQAAASGESSKTRQPDDLRSPPASTSSFAMGRIPQLTANGISKPPVPTINLPDAGPVIPTIVLPEEPDFAETSTVQSAPATPSEVPIVNVQPPTIAIHDAEEPVSRKAPQAQQPSRTSPSRPLPTHSATSPLPMAKPHYTPSFRPSNTLCAHCALPIAGRILSASGERFHPSCFVCHQCHTNLELVAFYPEPEKAHADRVSRILARQDGTDVPGEESLTPDQHLQSEINDGDPALRFYCHLDFHELFSPRCKSCKTPIEGEVVVACGAEWHVGHFFCAQCGDPFDSSKPFVEKDGYAWCVNCHTNRFSSKCKKCRRPVTDTVVKALGFDWHAECFVCVECNSEFQDGRYFLRGASQDPVCVRCEERRLKA